MPGLGKASCSKWIRKHCNDSYCAACNGLFWICPVVFSRLCRRHDSWVKRRSLATRSVVRVGQFTKPTHAKASLGSSSQVETKANTQIGQSEREKRAMPAWPSVHNSKDRDPKMPQIRGTGEDVPRCPWVVCVSESESDRLFTHQPSAMTGQGSN